MAFKSEAQRRKFQELHKQGKISKEVLDAFESDSAKKLPERVEKKRKALKQSKVWFAKVTK
jgi:hypothetical protein